VDDEEKGFNAERPEQPCMANSDTTANNAHAVRRHRVRRVDVRGSAIITCSRHSITSGTP
jgi:hypothetical protein